jgi:hypothetical protein
LHLSPALYRNPRQSPKDHAFHEETNQDHREQPGKDARGLQLRTIDVDEPADPAGAGADAEYQFGRDQRRDSESGKKRTVMDSPC